MKDTVKRLPVKSIQQMQAETAAAIGADYWACHRCGCRDWRVADSRFDGVSPRKRQRVCRNCHTTLATLEVPVPAGFKVVVVPE